MYKRTMKRFVRHMLNTWKQKLYAVAMIAIGVVCTMLTGGDATFLAVMTLFAVPMFLSKRTDWLV